ncbi:MAG: transcriptional repressor [Phycisphaerales bacterium]|nr:transcriptional repressor [Phycisphaerales bacterium]
MAKSLKRGEIDNAENLFKEYLRERGLKYTPERRTVLHAVLANDDHFEAEDLLLNLRKAGRRVAKATIYRTLPLLVDCGLINEAAFGEKHAHYENALSQGTHDHMICRRCRRIIEFDDTEVIRLRTALAEIHQFRAQTHRFQITGLCRTCQRNNSTHD